jgi:hypothetical protein
MGVEEYEREKHRSCDPWGHPVPRFSAHHWSIWVDLAFWLALVCAMLAMLAMFGGVKL